MTTGSSSRDVIVLGGGIVGAACAASLADAGLDVLLLDQHPPGSVGATSAGMGHLLVTDGSPAELALTKFSLEQWQQIGEELPLGAQFSKTKTMWLATSDKEMSLARNMHDRYQSLGINASILNDADVSRAEPNLSREVRGALRVEDEALVYPPHVVPWLLNRPRRAPVEVLTGVQVQAVRGGAHGQSVHVTCTDGSTHTGLHVVAALGTDTLQVLPTEYASLSLQPRKGHLAITAPVAPLCSHVLVELAYLAGAKGNAAESIAMNIQPRPTGQLLIGSSRQFGERDLAPDPRILDRILRRAIRYVPALARAHIVRTWAGFRAATPDHLPLIGSLPDRPGIILATGHEGLGITTSMGTAHLVRSLVLGTRPELDPTPYRPHRPSARVREATQTSTASSLDNTPERPPTERQSQTSSGRRTGGSSSKMRSNPRRPPRSQVSFTVDGKVISAKAGISVAAAMANADVQMSGEATAVCGMGSCFVCRATVDGVENERTCLVPVRQGLRVETITSVRAGRETANA